LGDGEEPPAVVKRGGIVSGSPSIAIPKGTNMLAVWKFLVERRWMRSEFVMPRSHISNQQRVLSSASGRTASFDYIIDTKSS
jgi:hypothetical protein